MLSKINMNKQIEQKYLALDSFKKRIANSLITVLATDLDGPQLKGISRCVGKHDKSDKRKPSGYIMFYRDQYPNVSKSNPGMSLGNIAKIVGKQWAAKSSSEKQVYNKEAAIA